MIISIGAACVQCPQCRGDGCVLDTDTVQCRTCLICSDGGPWIMGSMGHLDMPLTPDHAERIYCDGNADCQSLVNQEWRIDDRYIPPELRPVANGDRFNDDFSDGEDTSPGFWVPGGEQ